MKTEQVKVCISLDNGGVVILSVVTNDGKDVAAEPTLAYTDQLIAQHLATESGRRAWGGQPVRWRTITGADIPASREYREAWEDKDGRIQVNADKARRIQAERLAAAAIRTEAETKKQALIQRYMRELP